MGSSIHAFLEYDDRPLHTADGPSPPFEEPAYRVIDFTEYEALSHGKDYRFFAAISGFRNRTNTWPLVEPRGLPPNVSDQVRREIDKYFEPDFSGIGWLTLSEIEAVLKHMSVCRDDLSLAVQVVLQTMEFLVSRLGPEYVRFVFAIE